jgi:hypothetical protein
MVRLEPKISIPDYYQKTVKMLKVEVQMVEEKKYKKKLAE